MDTIKGRYFGLVFDVSCLATFSAFITSYRTYAYPETTASREWNIGRVQNFYEALTAKVGTLWALIYQYPAHHHSYAGPQTPYLQLKCTATSVFGRNVMSRSYKKGRFILEERMIRSFIRNQTKIKKYFSEKRLKPKSNFKTRFLPF